MPTEMLSLNMSGAKEITDYGLACIARNSPLLKEIKLSGCLSVGDAGIRELGLHCRQLTLLQLSGCHNIEGSAFISISECCPLLSHLDISHCRKLQRWGVHKLFSGCTKLEDVNISHLTCVGDEEIRILSQNNPHLTKLIGIEAYNISDSGLLSLSQFCSDLDYLDLSRKQMANRITDVSLLALGERLFGLKVLKLNGCDYVTDVGLNWLSLGCHALEIIELEGCNKVTDAGLRAIGSNCHSLTFLNISQAKSVSDVGIASIANGCPLLKQLVCCGLYLLADPRCTPVANKSKSHQKMMEKRDADEPWKAAIGVAALAKKCQNLEYLDLSSCFRLNQVLQKNLAKGLTSLKKLVLVGCQQAESTAFIAIGESCTLLEEINFSDCPEAINALVVQSFCSNCKFLRVIELARCIKIRGNAIKAISMCEMLEKLDLSGCTGLSDSSMLPICEVTTVPHLKNLYLLDIPSLSDTSLAWIATGCSSLQMLCLKGTHITHQACKAVADNFPYSDMIYNPNFIGFWPKNRLKDRILMNEYYKVQKGIKVIQNRARKMIAIRLVERKKRAILLFRAGMIVQGALKIFRAKRIVYCLRKEAQQKHWWAMKLLGFLRITLAKKRRKELFNKRLQNYHSKKSTIIQRAYRNYRSKKTVLMMQHAFFLMIRKRKRAIVSIQKMIRGYHGRQMLLKLREHVLAQTRVRRRKATLIQRVFRGHVTRSFVRDLREHLAHVHEIQQQAATKIQRLFRSIQTTRFLEQAIELKRRRNKGAIRLQAAIRGKLTRIDFTERLILRKERIEDISCRKIQNRWRVKKAWLYVSALIQTRAKMFLERSNASTTFAKYWRGRDARLLAKELKFQRDEAIRLRIQTEYHAAIRIQALWRGMKGRIYFDEKLREKKGKWKELMDEETGKRFFYNKLTGEIRWRMPRDLLDLIPRPVCDNCQRFEAGVECGICDEFFCHRCWSSVHSGGKRKDHEFRSLYDYYGKRIDYGDGNYPSKWPSEIQQDEVQGWMLRVAPIRQPVAIYGDWEHYFIPNDHSYDSYIHEDGHNFFFNRKTFEATYEPPNVLQHVTDTEGAQLDETLQLANQEWDQTIY